MFQQQLGIMLGIAVGIMLLYMLIHSQGAWILQNNHRRPQWFWQVLTFIVKFL
jgi:hypothetical protein